MQGKNTKHKKAAKKKKRKKVYNIPISEKYNKISVTRAGFEA